METFMESAHYKIENIPMLSKTKQDIGYASHWHAEIEITYILSGQVTVGVNSVVKEMSQGDIIICNPCDIHYFQNTGPNEVLLFFIDPKWLGLESFLDASLPNLIARSYLEERDWEQLDTLLMQIHQEYIGQRAAYKEMIHGLLLQFYALLHRSMIGQDAFPHAHLGETLHAIHRVLDYIDAHYQEPLTLSGIAAVSGYSVSRFSKLFKDVCGTSFVTFLNRKRIEEAKRLMAESHLSLLEISLSCGFSSYRSFHRCYQAFVGCAPSKTAN